MHGAPGRDVHVSVAARSIQPGELVVLTLTLPKHAERVRVRAFDHDMPVFDAGDGTWQALVGIDLDVTPGRHLVSIDAHVTGGDVHVSEPLLVRSKTFATRSLRVDENYVNPPAAVEERIAREAAEMRRIWQSSAHERLWTTSFVRPVPGASVSRFGTRSVFNGQSRNPHGGGDFLSPSGTPIHAPGRGRVALARELYFSGNTVIIDHGLGFFSLLAHLSAFDVHEGEVVDAGQVVGRVGATGRVTGAHLHWAVRIGGARVDPLAVLALLGGKSSG